MQQLLRLFSESLSKQNLIQAVFSSPLNKSSSSAFKIMIRPILLNNTIHYQISSHISQKVLHQNIPSSDLLTFIQSQILTAFKQGTLFTDSHDYHLLSSKTQAWKILTKPPTKTQNTSLQHNRQKNYIIPENRPLNFLIELGVMNREGRVVPAKRDKFVQINRFLEMVSDILPHLVSDKTLKIIDFGCGKAYLTFALHHYLTVVCHRRVEMVGLDLKDDVIAYCKQTSQKLNLKGLDFQVGAIGDYVSHATKVDMVVALHACDTATDAALIQAVEWNSDVILAVPCCQHELYQQVQCPQLNALLKHGILKERFAALLTDALRASALEAAGYSTQILEFIDSAHTPKNLLIRAVRGISSEKQTSSKNDFIKLNEMLHTHPSIKPLIIV